MFLGVFSGAILSAGEQGVGAFPLPRAGAIPAVQGRLLQRLPGAAAQQDHPAARRQELRNPHDIVIELWARCSSISEMIFIIKCFFKKGK